MAAPWSTALVTGASSGIGEAMARQLSVRGVTLVAVARSADRLAQLAEELPGDVEVLPADLADAEQVARVEDRLSDAVRPIDLLVNNAGFGANGNFLDLGLELQDEMVAVNVTAVLRLCGAALPGMLQRGRGAVVNVSSIAGLLSTPGLAVYSATKSFVTTFTESLHGELRGTGVTATAVLPGLTRTGFQARAGYSDDRVDLPGFVWQGAEEVAAEALAAAEKGRASVTTGGVNKVLAAASGTLPRSVSRQVSRLVNRRIGR
jgi:uncharacterized protein